MTRKLLTAPERPSVLFVGNFLDPVFGSRAVSADLALELNARGWRVLTVSNRRPKLARLLDMVGVVWNRRKQFDVAVLDVYSGPAFIFTEVVGWVLRRIGRPYVLVLHGGNLPAFSRKWPARVSRQLRAAAAITTPSRYLQEQLGCYRKDLGLIPNPLTLRNYRFSLRERARPALVWLRAFHRLYNPALAVAAVGLLAREFPEISLTMIGPDKGDGSLQEAKQRAAEFGVSDRIHFAGPIPKARVASFLEQADVFLNTTSVDNTPVSVLEAMACGLCIVSTNVGGIPYLLNDGTDALLVPPADSAAMAEALRRVFSDANLARNLSLHARRNVEHLDWSAILPQWEGLLASVAAGNQDNLRRTIFAAEAS